MKTHKMGSLLFTSLNYFIQILLVIACFYPFYYVIIFSISEPMKVSEGVYLLPKGFTLDTYRAIFQIDSIFQAFFISVSRTVLGTIITVFCSAFFAYLITKKEMYLRKLLYRLVIITMYLNAGLIPWYLTMKMYHLNNNFLLYILPGAVAAFFIILVKTFIEQLPPALEESAKIDGAGYITVFTKIIFPLSMPIIATIAVFSAVGNWNSWQDNYFLVTAQHLQTLQLVLYNYLNGAGQVTASAQQMSSMTGRPLNITPQSIKMAITVVVTIPILLVYPYMQKHFVKGMLIGAVKG